MVCHASAWDVTCSDDLRIKMCIRPEEEDLITVHHELGHNYYQHAYVKQPFLYMTGANDGFHEAVGDAIALSVTPAYLVKAGLLDRVPPANDKALINSQLKAALEKVAFLPFGKDIDEWRWQVFSGKVTPATYESAWWALRTKDQGVAPPVPRTEADFDPGAKYHVAANVPYTRYFLARVLEFQFYRAMCRAAGPHRTASCLLASRRARRRGESSRRCWPSERASPGPTRSRRSPASGASMAGRCWSTSRRSRAG